MAGFKQRKKLYGFYETGDVADPEKFKPRGGPTGTVWNPLTQQFEKIKPSSTATAAGSAGMLKNLPKAVGAAARFPVKHPILSAGIALGALGLYQYFGGEEDPQGDR